MNHRALTASTSLSTRGGISTYVRQLQATPLWERWRMVHVATHRDGGTGTKIATFAGALLRYGRELVTRRPDVVHLHMSAHGSFVRKALLFWLARARRVPVLVHVHGSEFAAFHDRLPALLRPAVRLTLEHAAVVIALGDAWGALLAAIAPRARVVTVPNGVRVPAEPVTVRETAPHLVFLGEIGERKGAFTLLDAWAKLAAEPDVLGGARLTMAGDREVERARAFVDAHGLAGSVTVRSWLAPAEVDALLADADAFVLPSRSEGQPMAVLEAMARGLAVVAGAVGGIPEMIEDGRSGLLVPPGDVDALGAALRSVLTDPARRRALGTAARERVLAEFDIDRVWHRIDTLYREAIGP